MKKILLIVAVVLCLAIAGTALAATQFYDVKNHEAGSIAADSYIYMSLDGSASTPEITLVDGKSSIYYVNCDVTSHKSSTVTPNGSLKVTLKPASGDGLNLTGVTVALYTDSACDSEHLVANSSLAGGTSEVYKVMKTGISTNTEFWIKVSFDTDVESATELAKVTGSMKIELIQA